MKNKLLLSISIVLVVAACTKNNPESRNAKEPQPVTKREQNNRERGEFVKNLTKKGDRKVILKNDVLH